MITTAFVTYGINQQRVTSGNVLRQQKGLWSLMDISKAANVLVLSSGHYLVPEETVTP